jgi:hypothetical protein
MAKRILVIESDDRGHFFLSIDRGTLTGGDSPGQPEFTIRDVHVGRVRCEVEVEEGIVEVTARPTRVGESGLKRSLHAGDEIRIKNTQFRLQSAGAEGAAAARTGSGDARRPAEPAPASAATAPVAAAGPLKGPKQLRVIDGADAGRSFRLPASGSQSIGKSSRHSDIVLHDLYVSRVHCTLEVQGDKVLVTHVEGENGTQINGTRINGKQELRGGDVLRVGNSQLRLEAAGASSKATERAADEEELPVVGEEVVAEEEQTDVAVGSAAKSPAGGDSITRRHAPVEQLLGLEDHVLSHYRVGPLLGRGHSGVVFRAQDLKSNQVVALKVLSPDFPANPAELQRFAGVLKATPHLHHVNLVTLYGAGKSGHCCWIAREYVEGESASRWIQRQQSNDKVDWTRAGRVALDLGRALGFLHEHKVVHGNITPRNVLIRSGDHLAKLADLMLAQALEGSKLQQAILEKKLLAELPYLAPEQADPEAAVDDLADLYSLGAVVYALLTGRPPFAGTSPQEVIAQVRKGQVPRPSSFQRGIPSAFEAIVLKLLAKHPEERYATAAELLADLDSIAQEHGLEP